jgi:hypothetical protein
MKNKILLLMAVATLGLTAKTMAQVPSYVPTNGLVGYWPLMAMPMMKVGMEITEQ